MSAPARVSDSAPSPTGRHTPVGSSGGALGANSGGAVTNERDKSAVNGGTSGGAGTSPLVPRVTLRVRAGAVLARLALAVASVVSLGALSFVLLAPVVLADAYEASAVRGGLFGGALALALLALRWARLVPVVSRVARACNALDAPAHADRTRLYAAPRLFAGTLAVFGFVALASGWIPSSAPPGPWRSIASGVGVACAELCALVLYAGVRVALRPLFEAIHVEPDEDALFAQHFAIDRLPSRLALAIGLPAGAAALIAALMVSAHVESVRSNDAVASREAYNALLSAEAAHEEDSAGLLASVSVLRRAGARVVETPEGPRVPPAPRPGDGLPLGPLAIAALVTLLAAWVGGQLGRSASDDVESAAHRLAVVGARDVRSVTMRMASPRSVPEIREMALALDLLAAMLLRMAEDQQRALTTRTEAARVRSFILASVSHDLRGPLNSVLGFADLLLSDVEGPLTPGQRESLDALGRGGRDLLRLVGDLLDHARIDAGRMTIERTRASLDDVVECARETFVERARLPREKYDVAIEGEAGLHLLADANRLGSSLGALVAFAVLRPGGDGRVVLRTRGDGDRVTVVIRGGGNTPSREALARMFEPFDLAPAGQRAPAGLSLAMSVARGVIALHAGTVLASPSDEGGITLTVSLPVAGE